SSRFVAAVPVAVDMARHSSLGRQPSAQAAMTSAIKSHGHFIQTPGRGRLATADRVAQPAAHRRTVDTRTAMADGSAVTKVQADPAPDNHRAIRCYERAGFRPIGAITTPDGAAVLMVLDRLSSD